MARLENDKWAGAQIAQSGRDVHLYVDGKLVEKIKDELSGAIWIKPDATGCEVVLRAKDTKVIDGEMYLAAPFLLRIYTPSSRRAKSDNHR